METEHEDLYNFTNLLKISDLLIQSQKLCVSLELEAHYKFRFK